MIVLDASPAVFSYFTIAEELAKRGFTVHFNGLHIDTYDIAEVQVVVLDHRSIWVELTVTVMPVGDEPRHMVTNLHAALEDGPLNSVQAAGAIYSAVQEIRGVLNDDELEVD